MSVAHSCDPKNRPARRRRKSKTIIQFPYIGGAPIQMDKVLELQAVLLRNHPQMSYKGVPSWPPRWIWLDGPEDKHPKGEVGVLRAVLLFKDRVNRCFLLIFHEQSSYMGCLLFDDEIFCGQITKLLEAHCNRHIAEIGCIDLSHTL